MSCMKGVLDIFINQLKDGDLMSVEQHKMLINTKAKQRHVYEFLNYLEQKRPQCIRSFWRCVFQKHMLQKYPSLLALKKSLHYGLLEAHMKNHRAKKQTQNETTKTAKKNSSDETEQMNLGTSSSFPSSQNTPAKQPRICEMKSFMDKQHEGKPRGKTTLKKNIETITGFSLQRQPKEISQKAKKCFLREHQSLVNELNKRQKKPKKTPTEKKNIKPRTDTKKIKMEKPAESPTTGSNPVLQFPPKQKKTTIKMTNLPITNKKSAKEPKQGVKPGPSSRLMTDQKQPAFAGEKKQDMPSVPLFKSSLYVTCGDKEGVLYPKQLARGELSIRVEDRWFIPTDFEKFGGKMNNKNWKQSIRHQNKPLQKFIESGQLQIPPTKKRRADESQDESKPGSSLSLSPHTFGAQAEELHTNIRKRQRLGVRSQHGDTNKVPGH